MPVLRACIVPFCGATVQEVFLVLVLECVWMIKTLCQHERITVAVSHWLMEWKRHEVWKRERETHKRMRMQREWMEQEGEQDIISDQCKALMSRITVAFHLHRCLKAGESVWLPTVSFWQYHQTSTRLALSLGTKHTHIATFISEKTHTDYQKCIYALIT